MDPAGLMLKLMDRYIESLSRWILFKGISKTTKAKLPTDSVGSRRVSGLQMFYSHGLQIQLSGLLSVEEQKNKTKQNKQKTLINVRDYVKVILSSTVNW